MGKINIVGIKNENLEKLLKQAENNDVVIFVGNGISRLVGIPSWDNLSRQCLEYTKTCYEEKDNFSYTLYERLKTYKNIRLLSVCLSRLQNDTKAKPFPLSDCLYKNCKSSKIHSLITNIECPIVTTNYDTLIEEALIQIPLSKGEDETHIQIKEEEKYRKPEQNATFDNLTSDKVIHLHGFINKNGESSNDLVLTLPQYLRKYKKNSDARKFLKKLFREKIVIFMGLGLEEYEIIEHIEPPHDGEDEPKHFLFFPCFKEEEDFLEELAEYYRTIGINIIPYDISKNGYIELLPLLESYIDRLKSTIIKHNKFKISYELSNFKAVSTYRKSLRLNNKERDVLNIIKGDEYYLKTFMKDSNNPTFLNSFISLDYFNSSKYEEDKGSLQWFPGLYLNNLIKNIKDFSPKEREIVSKKIKKVLESFIKTDRSHAKESPTIADIIKNTIHYNAFSLNINDIDTLSKEIFNTDANWRTKIIRRKWINILEEAISHCNQQIIETILINFAHLLATSEKHQRQDDLFRIYWLFEEKSKKLASLIGEKVISSLLKKLSKNAYKEQTIKFKINEQNFELSAISPNEALLKSKNKNLNIKIPPFTDRSKLGDFLSRNLPPSFSTKEKEATIKRIEDICLYSLWTDSFSFIPKNLFNKDSDINYPEEYLLFMIKKIISSIAQDNPTKFRKIKDDILDKYRISIFFRITLYCFGLNTKEYKEDFLSFLFTHKDILLTSQQFEKEIAECFKKISPCLSEEEETSLVSLIKNGPDKISEWNIEDPNNYIAHWKAKWFNLMKERPKIALLLKDLKVTPYDILNDSEAHIERTDKSPFDKDHIINLLKENPQKIITEIKIFDKKFKNKKSHYWDEENSKGLAETLEEISSSIENYLIINNIDELLTLDTIYVYHMVRGFSEAKESISEIYFSKLLKSLLKYISADSVWDIEDTSYGIYGYRTISTAIADLLKNNYEYFYFGKETKNTIASIYRLLVDRLINKKESSSPTGYDYFTASINNPIGRTIESLIDYSVSVTGKKRNEKSENIWIPELQKIYEDLLNAKIIEAYCLFGAYFQNMCFLNKTWALEENKKMQSDKFINDNSDIFMAIINGILYTRRVSPFTYKNFKKYYIEAIKHEKNKDNVADHMAVLYASGIEKNIDSNSLIYIAFEEKRFDILTAMIFPMAREYNWKNNKKRLLRIMPFWDYIYKNTRHYLESHQRTNEIASLVDNLLKFVNYLETWDPDIKEKIIFSIQAMDKVEHPVDYHMENIFKKVITLSKKKKEIIKDFVDIYIEFLGLEKALYQSEEMAKEIYAFIKNNAGTDYKNHIANIQDKCKKKKLFNIMTIFTEDN